MSKKTKQSQRPIERVRGGREARQQRQAAQRVLRARQKREGFQLKRSATRPNRKSPYETTEAEGLARNTAIAEQGGIVRTQLLELLGDFEKIPDPRKPKKIEHQITVVLLYGLLASVYQMGSRRKAQEKMSAPTFLKNLQELYPELTSIPHQDTLNHLLSRIDVDQIENAHVKLLRRLIRRKTFANLLIEDCYPLSIDGSQKLVRSAPKDDDNWQQRIVGEGENARPQYYVYVLEASLTFPNGMTLPLLTEFLSAKDGDTTSAKQDCERTAAAAKRILPDDDASEATVSEAALYAASGWTLCQWAGDGPGPSQ